MSVYIPTTNPRGGTQYIQYVPLKLACFWHGSDFPNYSPTVGTGYIFCKNFICACIESMGYIEYIISLIYNCD